MEDRYKRIMIVGRPGSGKTVFSEKLGKRTGRNIIHLDSYYWAPNWVKAYTSEAFKKKVFELASEDEWIIDGDFRSSLDIRVDRATTIVFFDLPAWKSVWGAYMRWIFGGTNRIDKHPGMRERVSLKLLQVMIFYNTKRIYKILSSSKDAKIFIIKNRKDSREVLDTIGVVKS